MITNITPKTLFTGQEFRSLPSCHSTNKVASEIIASQDASNGLVVYTENQTAGQGQFGNSWESEPGMNLTFSVVYIDTKIPVSDQFFLNIITSLSVYQTLTNYMSKKVSIKWPNDIYCGKKKICGILIKNSIIGNSIKNSIIGVGLNINQEKFLNPNATSMKLETGKQFDLSGILENILENLEAAFLILKEGRQRELKSLYLQNLFLINQTSEFEIKGVGRTFAKIVGVSDTGLLQLENLTGNFSCDLKEVIYCI